MFGSWLATVNELDRAAPRIAASSTMRRNPVMRLTSVAKAMPQDRETTAASDSSARRGGGAAAVLAAAFGRGGAPSGR
ncbi:hypothetical protein MTY81_49410 [Mycolicibacterium sp. TY81]|nr:hypothetical protein MTY81_49410 [Mycolicibacterium sp. TY81]